MYKEVTDIFFDLDHTLWDFEKNSALTFEMILSKKEVEVDLHDFLDVYRPINLSYWKLYREEKISKEDLRYQRLRNTFDALNLSISDNIILQLAEEYIELLSSFGHLIPNAMEVLSYLRPKYRLHIITNGFKETQRKKIRNAHIDHFFQEIMDSETAGVKKPHPQIFDLALSSAGARPKNSLMIGDNLEADIMGAQAVEMQAIHFNVHGEPEHNLCQIINGLKEIKNIL
ncbi:MAG: YjjG family noncanonical pyrimidine nucleotidase [Bacteroidota bacterium]